MVRTLTALKVLNFLGSILASFVLLVLLPIEARANSAAVQSFTYEGRLYDTAGNPLAESVDFRVQILNSASDCVLYEETQTFNLSSTSGRFALEVGSDVGAGKRTGDDPGFAMWQVFKNTGSLAVPAGVCPGTPFNPGLGEKRKLRVFIDPASGPEEKLSPDQSITSSPSSLMSQSLQGIGADGFVQITGNVTQSNLDDLSSEHTDLMDLAAGTSSLYMAAGSAVTTDDVFASDQMAVGTTTPAAGVELEIQDNDPTLRLEATDGGTGNMAIQFFDTAGTDQAQIMSTEGTAGLTFSTGGASALVLDGSQNAQFQASLTVAGTIQGGVYDNAQETGTLQPALTTCGAGCAGTQWMNSDLSLLRYWDGAAIRSVGSFSGAETAGQVLTSNGAGNAPTWQNPTASPTGSAGGDLSGTYPNPSIANDAITSAKILDGQVDTADLATESVTLTRLADEGGGLQSIRRNAGDTAFEYYTPLDNTTAFVNGGNSFAATAVIGTNDAESLQLETGNSVRVTIDSTGRVGVGTETPLGQLHVNGAFPFYYDRASSNAAHIALRSANGSPGSETAILDGDEIGQISFGGHDGTGMLTNDTGVVAKATENWTGLVNSGSELLFKTKENNTAGLAQARMTIKDNGQVGIGTTTPEASLHVLHSAKVGDGTANSSTVRIDAANFAWYGWYLGGTRTAFVQSTATGYQIFSETANVPMQFYTSSSERMRIDGAGNVGIGTTTPNEKLTLQGVMDFKEVTAPTTDVATYHKLYVDGADNKIKFRDETGTVFDLTDTGTDNDTTYTADGEGIEVASEDFSLELDGNTLSKSATGLKVEEGNLDHGSIGGLLDDDHTQYAHLAGRSGGQNLIGGTDASDDLTLESTSDATKGDLILQPNGGNVGVGTTAPAQPLHIINSSATAAIRLESSAGANSEPILDIQGQDSSSALIRYASGVKGGQDHALSGAVTDHDYWLKTNNLPRIAIKATTGNVGIGTTTPNFSLEVESPVNKTNFVARTSGGTGISLIGSSPSIGFNSYYQIPGGWSSIKGGSYTGVIDMNPGTGHFSFFTGDNPASDGDSATMSNRMVILNSGNVGIGTTTPDTKLEVDGGIKIGTMAAGDCDAVGEAGRIRYNSGDLDYCDGSSWQTLGTAAGGEVNTAANVGTGSGLFRDKTGSTINLKSINAEAGGEISITANPDDITLDVVEGNLDITAIGGYDANDNIDHTSVDMIAGDGLTGGGDISADRTFNVVGGDGITANADDITVNLDTDPGLEFNTGALRVKTGTGLSRDATGIFHSDTSSVADSDNSNGVILQDITFDTFGHVQTVGTTDLDGRYYTETESDSNFVDTSGDTMTGALSITGSADAVQLSAQAQAAQAANLFELKNSAGIPIFTVQADGTISAATDIVDKDYVDTEIAGLTDNDTLYTADGLGIEVSSEEFSLELDGTTLSKSAAGLKVEEGNLDHGSIGGLLDDDHTQYALLAGRSGGQSLIGGTDAGDDLTLESTSNATKGDIALNPNGGNIGLGSSSPSHTVHAFSTASDIAKFETSQAFGAIRLKSSLTTSDATMPMLQAQGDKMVVTGNSASLHVGDGGFGLNTFPAASSLEANVNINLLGGNKILQNGEQVFFNNGTNTVIKGGNTGGLEFRSGGNPVRIFVESTGEVGIGTTSPNAKLTVEGSVTLDQLALDPTGTAGYGSLYTKTDGSLYYRDGTGTVTNISTGAAGGDITEVIAGTGLTGGSSSGPATLNVDVGTSNGKIIQADATGLPVIDGSQVTNLSAGNLSGTVSIANGGTGQTTANGAFNALAPAQATHGGKFLTTDGTNTSWATVSGDDLGDHTATSNIVLGSNYLSGDGDNEGISVLADGKVGVGTASPSSLLEVSGNGGVLTLDSSGASNFAILTQADPSTAGSTLFRNRYQWNGTDVAEIRALSGADFTNKDDGELAIFTAESGVLSEALRVDKDGKVGIGTTSPNPSALLDVSSTTKGFLPPRMTTIQRTAVLSPAEGLIVFDTDEKAPYVFKDSAWAKLADTTEVTFKVHRNGVDQSIPASTTTLINWTTEDFDSSSSFDPATDRFQPTIPGYYFFRLSASFDNIPDARRGNVYIRKNGSTVSSGGEKASNITDVDANTDAVVYLNGTTDYVDFAVWQNDVAAKNLFGTASSTSASGFLISGGTGGGAADDLGNHTAAQNIVLGSNYLSGDGDDEGLQVDTSGNVTFSADATFNGNVDLSSATIADNSISIDDLDFASGNGINIPQLASDPGSPTAGQMYYNTSTNKMMIYNGSSFVEVGSGAGGGGGAPSSIQTFTSSGTWNKPAGIDTIEVICTGGGGGGAKGNDGTSAGGGGGAGSTAIKVIDVSGIASETVTIGAGGSGGSGGEGAAGSAGGASQFGAHLSVGGGSGGSGAGGGAGGTVAVSGDVDIPGGQGMRGEDGSSAGTDANLGGTGGGSYWGGGGYGNYHTSNGSAGTVYGAGGGGGGGGYNDGQGEGNGGTGAGGICVVYEYASSSSTIVADADLDTMIQMQEAADEDKIRFDTAGSERMIIDENGNVGIGTSSPATLLDVQSDGVGGYITSATFKAHSGTNYADSGTQISIQDNLGEVYLRQNSGSGTHSGPGSTYDALLMNSHNSFGGLLFGTDDQVRMTIDHAGNIGMGVTAPTENLEVAGNVKGVMFVSSSDRNLKRDIATLDGGLSKIKQLRGVTYHWRMDEFPERNFTPEKQYGVIAQEVEQIFPELVRGTEGDKSVHYIGLISPLIEATKEVAAMCEMSEEQNQKLAGLVAANSREIASMQERLKSQEDKIEKLSKENAELKEKLNKVMKHLGL